MTLRFEILGLEICRLQFDCEPDAPSPAPIVAKGVKAVSKLWLKGMLRG
jgi:hypothetical protein